MSTQVSESSVRVGNPPMPALAENRDGDRRAGGRSATQRARVHQSARRAIDSLRYLWCSPGIGCTCQRFSTVTAIEKDQPTQDPSFHGNPSVTGLPMAAMANCSRFWHSGLFARNLVRNLQSFDVFSGKGYLPKSFRSNATQPYHPSILTVPPNALYAHGLASSRSTITELWKD
jgi:hypothetical protein